MAKRKKGKGRVGNMVIPQSTSGRGHLSTSIDEADNGFIVNVSGETSGKTPTYFSKRFISPTHDGALAIASTHLAGGKSKKKKGGKKKISLGLKRG